MSKKDDQEEGSKNKFGRDPTPENLVDRMFESKDKWNLVCEI